MTIKTGHELAAGDTTSCGCLHREQLADRSRKHGRANRGNRTYNSWVAMRQRCSDPNATQWTNYGGRGISVCERWNEFDNFLADMGERPQGKTLDRIAVDGDYTPDNCRWATNLEQARNKRRTA